MKFIVLFKCSLSSAVICYSGSSTYCWRKKNRS